MQAGDQRSSPNISDGNIYRGHDKLEKMIDMMKTLTAILLMMLSITAAGQRQVIATAGNSDENAEGSLSWTMGEPAVNTWSSSGAMITQGFQQSNLEVSTLVEPDPGSFLRAIAYPNPVQDMMRVEVKNRGNTILYLELYDMNGRLLDKQQVQSNPSRLDFGEHPAGEYILQLKTAEKRIQSFKIIKR